ncbi:MAG: TIM barrel protein [Chloroflexi bacterium]|nr:TIM barrel protein [Chloroflexota bacterium]
MPQLTPHFAARLNSFAARPDLFWHSATNAPSTLALLERAAAVPGLSHVDLNYPDHALSVPLADLKAFFQSSPLHLNGLEMRYYSDPAFALGAFTHPDAGVRAKAIDLTRRGIDLVAEMGGTAMNLWLGQDGFDYTFQVDYQQVWQWEIEGIRQVAAHNPDILVSIEYKPNEPRAFSLLGDIGTTLLAIREINLPNLGVTLDFCHQLIAEEQPAFGLALVRRYSQLIGVHLNDGYRSRDDGLMVGSVHPLQTLELLYYLRQMGYQRTIYFDTFPRSEDPIEECAANIATVRRMIAALEHLSEPELERILRRQDAVSGQKLLMQTLMRL